MMIVMFTWWLSSAGSAPGGDEYVQHDQYWEQLCLQQDIQWQTTRLQVSVM